MMNRLMKICIALWCVLWLAVDPLVVASDSSGSSAADIAIDNKSVDKEVEVKAEDKTAERRERIMQDAVDALAKTRSALKALEEDRTNDALEALAAATGKLELIVAREPSLALAPTGVVVSRHDVLGTKESINNAIKEVQSAIEDGDIQGARRLLDGLASEIVISVSNLPLATYPDAIKAITPLIDTGKIDSAKAALQTALNTVVVSDYIVPLPVIRTEALLEKAEALTEKKDRSAAEKSELAMLLQAARSQLEIAQMLGYGDEADFNPFYTQLSDIEKKTEAGQSGTGLFDKLKGSMSKLWN